MAKRKFRIEGGNYGGELVIREVSNEFVAKAITLDQSDLVDAVLQRRLAWRGCRRKRRAPDLASTKPRRLLYVGVMI